VKAKAWWAGCVILGVAFMLALVAAAFWMWFDLRRVERICNQKCGGEANVYEAVPGLDVPGHCTCWLGHDHLLRYDEIAPSVDLF
jgi:hypothetical protein